MSGIITPIIDTLLHDVLGKRVDAQSHREFLEPIKPLSPGHAPRAVYSDSRLNTEQSAIQRQSSIGNAAAQRQAGGDASLLAPLSTQTHFSPAARSIAEILAKFPAPPSVLKASRPLIGSDGTGDVSQVASRLRQSIETSGLFYESHQARWLRGEMPRASLLLEPQAQLFPPPLPVPGPEVARRVWLGTVPWAMSSGDASTERALSLGRQGLANATFVPLALTPPAASLIPGAPMSGSGQITAQNGQEGQLPLSDNLVGESLRSLPVSEWESSEEVLQGLVRHQLEMLVAPTLRWEGDLWTGVFMALAIHVPDHQDERSGAGEESASNERDDDSVWYSEINLQLPRLGNLHVHFHMRNATLSLTLESESHTSLDELRADVGTLEKRLKQAGSFEEVRISILTRRHEPETGAP